MWTQGKLQVSKPVLQFAWLIIHHVSVMFGGLVADFHRDT
jgi:hypothetical protein